MPLDRFVPRFVKYELRQSQMESQNGIYKGCVFFVCVLLISFMLNMYHIVPTLLFHLKKYDILYRNIHMSSHITINNQL